MYMLAVGASFSSFALASDTAQSTSVNRWISQIEEFRRLDARNAVPRHPVLFIGSSSIVRWETARAFPSLPVVNRGFGGATIEDVNTFYDDVVRRYKPAVIVMYCDNDIYQGASAETMLRRFEVFASRVEREIPQPALLFLSIKPTPTDAQFGAGVRERAARANRMIEEFVSSRRNMKFVDVTSVMFVGGQLRTDLFEDGMHLNAAGYALWNPLVAQQIAQVYLLLNKASGHANSDGAISVHPSTSATGCYSVLDSASLNCTRGSAKARSFRRAEDSRP